MTEASKVWSVCADTLLPLSNDLSSLASQLAKSFNLAKYDDLYREFDRLYDRTRFFPESESSEEDHLRFEELQASLRGLKAPPSRLDVASIYKTRRIDVAIEWLKFNASAGYGHEFQSKLDALKDRCNRLGWRALQILARDHTSPELPLVPFAIQRVIALHNERLRFLFPGSEEYPSIDEMPAELQVVEAEIVQGLQDVIDELRDVSTWLKTVASVAGPRRSDPVTPSDDHAPMVERSDNEPDVTRSQVAEMIERSNGHGEPVLTIPPENWCGDRKAWPAPLKVVDGYDEPDDFYRDAWLYVQRRRPGQSNTTILSQLNTTAYKANNWTPFESPHKLRDRIAAIAEHLNWPTLSVKSGPKGR